ncbi:Rieske 2Fe-2S domain-containing protein [Chryseolinea sp. T2]|uniref:Rieske (2Fe-2S) protein n=1 Tax=Chryseolinea sp. T2 TaxID=3129255 RepID=UPI003076AFE8
MEWLKIFGSEEEARQRIREHKPQLIAVRNKRICLVMHDNQFYAIQDSCSHQGESLSKGKVNGLGEIVCPWHYYRFEVATGRPMDSSCPDLATYPLKLTDEGLFIGV